MHGRFAGLGTARSPWSCQAQALDRSAERGEQHVNRCDLCEQDKDEAMLLLKGGDKRQACGACVCDLVQGQAGLVQLAALDEAMAIIVLGILQAAAR
jgi:hypothetical protein